MDPPSPPVGLLYTLFFYMYFLLVLLTLIVNKQSKLPKKCLENGHTLLVDRHFTTIKTIPTLILSNINALSIIFCFMDNIICFFTLSSFPLFNYLLFSTIRSMTPWAPQGWHSTHASSVAKATSATIIILFDFSMNINK